MIDSIKQANRVETAPIAGTAGGDDGFMALDDRMLKAYAQSAVDLDADRKNVMRQLEQVSGGLSDPGQLFAIQQQVSDYALHVSLTSTLTRKGVSAVETLLRA